MRVLVACEFSQIVTQAFRDKGHDAFSCDILPTKGSKYFHLQGDIRNYLYPRKSGHSKFTHGFTEWDLLIAHPPCTRLTNAASKHLYKGCRKENGICQDNWQQMEEAAEFYNILKDAPIEKKCRENPIMHCHARERVGGRATQYVQPWWFGSKKNKATGLRLYNLPPLVKTNAVGPMPKTVKKGTAEYRSWNECWYMSPGPERGLKRAMTDPAIAFEMAEQWGG